jgi:hypothetical protein
MQAGQSHFPMIFFPHRRHFLSFRLMMIGPGFGAYRVLMIFPPIRIKMQKKVFPDSGCGQECLAAKPMPPPMRLEGDHER